MRDDARIPDSVSEFLAASDVIVPAYERRRAEGLSEGPALRSAVADAIGPEDAHRLLGELPSEFTDEFCRYWEPRRVGAPETLPVEAATSAGQLAQQMATDPYRLARYRSALVSGHGESPRSVVDEAVTEIVARAALASRWKRGQRREVRAAVGAIREVLRADRAAPQGSTRNERLWRTSLLTELQRLAPSARYFQGPRRHGPGGPVGAPRRQLVPDWVTITVAAVGVAVVGAIAVDAVVRSTGAAQHAFKVNVGEAVVTERVNGAPPMMCARLTVVRVGANPRATVSASSFSLLAPDGIERPMRSLDSSIWDRRQGTDLTPGAGVGAAAAYLACFSTPTTHGTFTLHFAQDDGYEETWGFAFP